MAESDPPRPSLRASAEKHGPTALVSLVVALLGGGGVTALVSAFRTPADPEVKIRVDILEAERLQAIKSKPYEDAREEAREAERKRELEQLRGLIRDLDARCPVIRPDPDRQPR